MIFAIAIYIMIGFGFAMQSIERGASILTGIYNGAFWPMFFGMVIANYVEAVRTENFQRIGKEPPP